ncbi:MAG: Chromatin associated protein KTI12 [Candidatus Moranbacteria bacterium GW2011_GWC2_37_73]|nr:MAG: seg [Parcubacteria group bacterium GW2011_GWC1_36_108]KKP99986.1 MAG: Chromatin associated protein KTI12 [Candidatus Moranbacteria bacterium GW2011_GWD1_36_198]KKQ00253.1 MAG: Chromatin associated protein KTI12 [Candidatus Moranbacteria bacterium GW2011_GWD2_36_198]KKQ39329.1 MAG: Chromatin associated protein KTI12 [Candidatus Moranbacteria bacterium GW2011_GWC2_37_73]HAR99896.1 hypothetical protein [Candidatus Moranbacteria bacterium]
MSKLILVCGLPGVGKTTLANELSKKMKVACIHKDSIKEVLFESMNLSTLEDSKRIGKPSVDVMFYLIEEQLKNNIDVIMEAPFNFSEDYPIFVNWKEKYNLQLFSIVCSIDSKERKKRFQERERHHSHHDIDRQMIDLIETTEYDYSTIPGKQIKIETNESVEKLVEKIVDEINLQNLEQLKNN